MLFFGHLLVRSLAQRRAPMSIPSREGLTQKVPYRIDGLNVSVSREARVGRSGDSARKRRVASLLATCGAGCTVKVCRETRRARRQWRKLTQAVTEFVTKFLSTPNSLSFRQIIWEIERPNDGLNWKNFCQNICRVSSPPA